MMFLELWNKRSTVPFSALRASLRASLTSLANKQGLFDADGLGEQVLISVIETEIKRIQERLDNIASIAAVTDEEECSLTLDSLEKQLSACWSVDSELQKILTEAGTKLKNELWLKPGSFTSKYTEKWAELNIFDQFDLPFSQTLLDLVNQTTRAILQHTRNSTTNERAIEMIESMETDLLLSVDDMTTNEKDIELITLPKTDLKVLSVNVDDDLTTERAFELIEATKTETDLKLLNQPAHTRFLVSASHVAKTARSYRDIRSSPVEERLLAEATTSAASRLPEMLKKCRRICDDATKAALKKNREVLKQERNVFYRAMGPEKPDQEDGIPLSVLSESVMTKYTHEEAQLLELLREIKPADPNRDKDREKEAKEDQDSNSTHHRLVVYDRMGRTPLHLDSNQPYTLKLNDESVVLKFLDFNKTQTIISKQKQSPFALRTLPVGKGFCSALMKAFPRSVTKTIVEQKKLFQIVGASNAEALEGMKSGLLKLMTPKQGGGLYGDAVDEAGRIVGKVRFGEVNVNASKTVELSGRTAMGGVAIVWQLAAVATMQTYLNDIDQRLGMMQSVLQRVERNLQASCFGEMKACQIQLANLYEEVTQTNLGHAAFDQKLFQIESRVLKGFNEFEFVAKDIKALMLDLKKSSGVAEFSEKARELSDCPFQISMLFQYMRLHLATAGLQFSLDLRYENERIPISLKKLQKVTDDVNSLSVALQQLPINSIVEHILIADAKQNCRWLGGLRDWLLGQDSKQLAKLSELTHKTRGLIEGEHQRNTAERVQRMTNQNHCAPKPYKPATLRFCPETQVIEMLDVD